MATVFSCVDKGLSIMGDVHVELDVEPVGFVLFEEAVVGAGLQVDLVEAVLLGFLIKCIDDCRIACR